MKIHTVATVTEGAIDIYYVNAVEDGKECDAIKRRTDWLCVLLIADRD